LAILRILTGLLSILSLNTFPDAEKNVFSRNYFPL